MKDKYWIFYKGINRENDKNGFINFCEFLDSNNIELLSDYNNNHTKVKIKISNFIIDKRPMDVAETINVINKFTNSIKLNNDVFLYFITSKRNLSAKILTFDGNELEFTCLSYDKFIKTRNKFLKEINNNGHKLLSKYSSAQNKVLIDYGCGHEPSYQYPTAYLKGFINCPICNNYKVQKGINDIATTNPELVKYFINVDDAYKYTAHSSKEVELRCPICNFTKTAKVKDLIGNRFVCPQCKNTKSYPNRFMFNLLTQNNIEFDKEVHFEWCNFKKYKSDIYTYGIYDFVLKNQKIIIEMDGGWHKNNNKISGQTKIESKYIDNCKDHLAYEHGYDVIRVDCDYVKVKNRLDYIINSINNSNLVELINIDKTDYNFIDYLCLENEIKTFAELWNSGYTTTEIGKLFKINTYSVSERLKKANNYSLCNYTIEDGNKRGTERMIKNKNYYVGIYKNNSLIQVCNTIREASKNMKGIYNININESKVNRICNNNQKTDIEFDFKYISKHQSPELAFGDYFISTEETKGDTNK